MVFTYLLLLVAALTFFVSFSHLCKLLALINLVQEAQDQGTLPDRGVVSEIDKVFTILCYLVGSAIAVIYLFKILYEKSLI